MQVMQLQRSSGNLSVMKEVIGKKFASDDLLTVGDIAKLCRVHRTTVGRWLKKRGLKTQRTFSGHRRVTARQLVTYLGRENMDIPPELQSSVTTRVLVIDDEDQVRQVISQALTRIDETMEVKTAGDGPTGCMLVGSYSPDVVILDLKMPGMDGFEVCKSLAKLPWQDRPIILVLTGYASDENVRKAYTCGADELLSKPVNVDQVYAMIRELLRTKTGQYLGI